MILIADSGSTKTEWCLAEKGVAVKTLFTVGINPYFQTPEEISVEITNNLYPALAGYEIEAVYFYGAGCAFPDKNKIVEVALQACLPVPVEVCSDLVGAARALCHRQPGIACILGTGSNSCLYDGAEIRDQISPLGFILGDEGSGAVLGKRLVGDCLKRQLPEPLAAKFLQQYALTPAILLERVYKQPFPNRFLAGLSRFLLENLHEPSLRTIVYTSFQHFLIRNVMPYEGAGTYPIHFTGSVAFHYREVLKEAAHALQLTLGTLSQTPMPGLLVYHT